MHLNKISSKEYKAVMKSYPTSLMGAVAAPPTSPQDDLGKDAGDEFRPSCSTGRPAGQFHPGQ